MLDLSNTTSAQIDRLLEKGELVDARSLMSPQYAQQFYPRYEETMRKFGYEPAPPIYIHRNDRNPIPNAWSNITADRQEPFFQISKKYLTLSPEALLGAMQHEAAHLKNRDMEQTPKEHARRMRDPKLNRAIEERADKEGACIGGHPEWLLTSFEEGKQAMREQFFKDHPKATEQDFVKSLVAPDRPGMDERIAYLRQMVTHPQVCHDILQPVLPPDAKGKGGHER